MLVTRIHMLPPDDQASLRRRAAESGRSIDEYFDALAASYLGRFRDDVPSLLRRLKLLALERGITLTRVLTEASSHDT